MDQLRISNDFIDKIILTKEAKLPFTLFFPVFLYSAIKVKI